MIFSNLKQISLVPYSKFSTIFKKKICYLRDLYCEAMLVKKQDNLLSTQPSCEVPCKGG
jgi:hypothetical protein